jgi:hypothetical protein
LTQAIQGGGASRRSCLNLRISLRNIHRLAETKLNLSKFP